MKGNLKKYSDGWFIESIIDDNEQKLPPTVRVKVNPEQLSNDIPYHSKYGVDDLVHFEVRKVVNNSDIQVIDDNIAFIIDKEKTDNNEMENEIKDEKQTQDDYSENYSVPKQNKMSYEVLINQDSDKLVELVNEYIGKDWIPQGGVCVDNRLYHQAMVKVN